jgi:hypothetical protein
VTYFFSLASGRRRLQYTSRRAAASSNRYRFYTPPSPIELHHTAFQLPLFPFPLGCTVLRGMTCRRSFSSGAQQLPFLQGHCGQALCHRRTVRYCGHLHHVAKIAFRMGDQAIPPCRFIAYPWWIFCACCMAAALCPSLCS